MAPVIPCQLTTHPTAISARNGGGPIGGAASDALTNYRTLIEPLTTLPMKA